MKDKVYIPLKLRTHFEDLSQANDAIGPENSKLNSKEKIDNSKHSVNG